MVEIFKTNVRNKSKSRTIVSMLEKNFPKYKINFDLDDCDKILRIESNNGHIDIESVLKIVRNFLNEIELIPD